jgi:hypothetical protein
LRIIDEHDELITTVPRASNGEISRCQAGLAWETYWPAMTAQGHSPAGHSRHFQADLAQAGLLGTGRICIA